MSLRNLVIIKIKENHNKGNERKACRLEEALQHLDSIKLKKGSGESG